MSNMQQFFMDEDIAQALKENVMLLWQREQVYTLPDGTRLLVRGTTLEREKGKEE